ncbi:MAG: YicC family protein [Clostridiaceae bacterium]|jgi:uncharacterized protein (TIGR00255 family)|nr:YicC family protein [Clostridiaceae bacterium]
MLKSMTGYGYYEYQDDDIRMSVEIKSVNHRFCDVYIRIPRQLSCFEDKVRYLVTSRVSRGKLDVYINWENIGEGAKKVILDEALARAYFDAMNKLADDLDLREDISLSVLARFPEILRIEKKEENNDTALEILQNSVNKAIDMLVEMRKTEGEKLLISLISICRNIENYREKLLKRAPYVVLEYKEKLASRIKELIEVNMIDETRIAMEVAVFADKCSINEELVRLKSHVEQFEDIIKSDGPVGKKLEFLVQEMNREVNTIGSKANDLDITKIVVNLKSEIENLREQIQNIE